MLKRQSLSKKSSDKSRFPRFIGSLLLVGVLAVSIDLVAVGGRFIVCDAVHSTTSAYPFDSCFEQGRAGLPAESVDFVEVPEASTSAEQQPKTTGLVLQEGTPAHGAFLAIRAEAQRLDWDITEDYASELSTALAKVADLGTAATSASLELIARGEIATGISQLLDAAIESENVDQLWRVADISYTVDDAVTLSAFQNISKLEKKNADVLNMIANLYVRTGREAEAKRTFAEALEVNENDDLTKLESLYELGVVLFKNSNTRDKSIEKFEGALRVATLLGEKENQALVQKSLAAALISKEENRKGQMLLESSISIYKELDDKKNLAEAYFLLGTSHLSVNPKSAVASYELALDSILSLNPDANAPEIEWLLVEAQLQVEDLDAAQKTSERVLAKARRAGDNETMAFAQLLIFRVAHERNDFSASQKALNTSASLLRGLDSDLEEIVRRQLAGLEALERASYAPSTINNWSID